MTKIIRNFPVRSRAGLVCVWIETGNPRQPLACKWIAGQQSNANRPPAVEALPTAHRLCA